MKVNIPLSSPLNRGKTGVGVTYTIPKCEMARTIRILMQTTTPGGPDDWSIGSFSLLTEHLANLQIEGTRFEVTARNRVSGPNGDDPVLAALDRSQFDELWLFALDTGTGITAAECGGITRFRQRGGGILTTRDHQDMGSSLCTLEGIGAAHQFQNRNPDPDRERYVPDDIETPSISWPNYHSGQNGDYQKIIPIEPLHELLWNPITSRRIEFFPSHPHEGSVGKPPGDQNARVIACGTSLITGRRFNLVVAIDRSRGIEANLLGRGIAQSSIHHFADYNWDTERGAPSFVTEPTGQGMKTELRALADIKQYVNNLAVWLAPQS
jgi:hypothetical protein